ncbi:vacuolar basic amino acid transporter 2 [[Candida] railenensis]|uniref:Vacuolar basic amino acid transporter 2 n=1 Tax=[Candida] railenensis TaxID=45579 RepID=A0A9P0QUN6_9ASCO|nr:vacuolar basic amino acid transporter 2 [[Candida] railenensis]
MALLKKSSSVSVLVEETNANYGSVNAEGEESSSVESIEHDGFSSVPNFFWMELSLLSNVFLSGFDATVTASTYTTIGNEFDSVNLASWITTSYLITSTAFQPLYGSFSDVLGRRVCLFFAIAAFTVGCLGCSLASDLLILNVSRALAGVGGGGLLTLATVINSDIVPIRKRGLFQAFQNLCMGLGSISGASFGGIISDKIGWRWCFILQIPPCLVSFIVAYFFIQNQPGYKYHDPEIEGGSILEKIDVSGSLVLVTALTIQVFVLTLGGNEIPWSDYKLILLGLIGLGLIIYFVYIELNTRSVPIIPIKRFHSLFSVLMLTQNFFLGLSSYAYLFVLPLLFQFVLGDSPSRVGLRLAIPALSTPIGSIITGVLMNKYNCLKPLVYTGTFIMSFGNFLVLLVSPKTSSRILDLLLVPANLGQGIAYPSCLFTFIFAFSSQYQAASTSTIYLSRSVGGVWGVSCVSAIIQGALKIKLNRDFHNNETLKGYSEKKIAKLIDRIAQSTDVIKTLPDDLKQVVTQDYEEAIRLAQLFSCICCTLAFVCCLLRDIFKAKPNPT